ncbi:MAG TPA: sensor histidine kinase [Candidatus Mediterraneibacter vanvlietii]|nr:sensor histidine kinase [Candidatus Mediterraneibacter vanvlietii]
MKLRTRFFLIFSILAVIPLLILTEYSYVRYRDITYERMDELSENLFQNAVTQTNNMLSTVQTSISYLTFYSNENDYSVIENLRPYAEEDTQLTAYDTFRTTQHLNGVFQNIMASYDYITGIYIFTPSDVTFSCSQSSNILSSRYSPKGKNWYENTLAQNGHFYVSAFMDPDMFIGEVEDAVYFSLSINDLYTNEFLGVILVSCDSDIFDLSTVNTMPETTLLYISSKETNYTLYSNIDELPESFSGTDAKIKKTDLAVDSLELTAAFDYDSLYAEFSLTGALFLVVAFTCILIFLVLAYVMTKNMIRPLEELSTTMSRQGKDLSFYSPYMNRTDEIGTLYNEYSNMLEELNASIKRDYQDKLNILDAQMKSLEARINSHFLFNTLESINSMAEIDENEDIATMSLALGNMFRYAIKTPSEIVTLRDEINHVKDYVSIQSIRFSNKFTLTLDIPDELYQQKVLKLILQPLVENSFYHGLNYCTAGDNITIQAKRDSTILYITVSDNGQGMTQEVLDELRAKLSEEASFTELGHRNKQGIGLKNIHSRIELYYGRGYGLSITSTPGEGTSITIKIPVLQGSGVIQEAKE